MAYNDKNYGDDDMIDISDLSGNSRNKNSQRPSGRNTSGRGSSSAGGPVQRYPGARGGNPSNRSRQPAARQNAGQGSQSVQRSAAKPSGKAKNVKKDGMGKSIAKKVGLVFLTIFLVGFFTAAISAFTFYRHLINDIDATINYDLNNLKLNQTSIVYVKNPETDEYYEYTEYHAAEGNRIWVDLDDISQNLQNAFVAIEDKRFKTHSGVDWRRTTKAVLNMFGSGSQQGGSTITQQLIKNLTNDNEATPERKVQEIMRALELEKNYSKSTILECYLNTINLDGRYGVETAAIYYFGKSAKDLDIAESACIAAITKSPSYYNPIKHPENNEQRRKQVLAEMYNQEMITQKEYEEAKKEELKFVGKDSVQTSSLEVQNYYIDLMTEDIIDDLMETYGYSENYAKQMLYCGGLRIYCSMDTRIQGILDEGFIEKNNLFRVLAGDIQPQAAMMIMDYNGNVVGVAGGRGAKTTRRGLNRVLSKRQPGSSIKPLSAYAPAMEEKLITYSSIVNDSPLQLKIDGKTKSWPNNYSMTYSGRTTLQHALKISLNTVPAQLVKRMSLNTSYNYLTEKFHMSTVIPTDMAYAPLSVGAFTNGVTVRDMTAAYATFGNLGKYYKPSTYSVVTDAEGRVVLEKDSNGEQVISEETSYIMNKLLQKVVAEAGATGTVAQLKNGMPVYAKTGTTNDYKDLYFVGGTPYYVAAVWYGYDQPSRLPYGRDKAPHLAWKAVMDKINSALNLKVKSFPNSDKVEVRYYCTDTGKLATTNCPGKVKGYYASNNLPDKCPHGGTLLNKISGGSGKSYIGSSKEKDYNIKVTESTTEGKTTKPEKTTGERKTEEEKPTKKTTEKPTKKTTEKPTEKPTRKTTEPATEPATEPEPITKEGND